MLYVGIGLALGLCFGLGWLFAQLLTQRKLRGEVTNERSRAVAAEARIDELRRQIEVAAKDFEELHQKVSSANAARSALEAQLAEVQAKMKEQKELLDEAQSKLTDTFKSLAADALANNRREFYAIAEEKFKALQKESSTDLEHRKNAIEQLVKPLGETLKQYQEEARQLEEKRLKDVSKVGEQLRSLSEASSNLQVETAKLVNALRSPQVRGRWGELALRKTAELAGMSQFCDFDEQQSFAGEDGRLRPDMIVRLPAGRNVVVDSKVPLEAFLQALEASNEEARSAALLRHSSQVKSHIAKLASKEYARAVECSLDFVVMFIPNDSFLAAAAEQDPNLIERALTQNVVIATPTTFIALLKAVAYGWRQEQVAENAQRVFELGQTIAERIVTFSSHLETLGKALNKSVETYNKAVGSFERRVLKATQRIEDLGAKSGKAIPDLTRIETAPVPLSTVTSRIERPVADAAITEDDHGENS